MNAPAAAPADRRSWDGKAVIVTGGGSGIGRATAVAFAERGAYVLVTGRREQRLAETTAQHPGISSAVADARDPAAAARVVDDAAHRWGRVDVLVNNAATGAYMPLAETDAGRVQQIFATNVVGPTILARAALPNLRRARGAIINVSSNLGQLPGPPIAHYAASKAALDSLTRSWALDLAADGVRVNAVAPGPTETAALDELIGLPAEAAEQVRRQETARNPLRRRGRPEEIATWIVALADPAASSWITGQVLTIDGGETLVV